MYSSDFAVLKQVVSRTLSGNMAASYVLLILVLSAAWTNGQVVFGDEDAPSKPPTSNGNTNSNNNFPAGQQTRSQFPLTGFAINGINGLAGVSQQLGSLVNQFINPFIPGGGPGQQRPPPGNFEDDRNGGCRTFQNGRGTCTRLNNCASLNNILNSRPPFQANRILRRSICGFSGNGPLVCCPFDESFGGNGGNFGGQGGNGGQFGQGGGGNFGNGNFGGQGGNGGNFGGNGGQFGQGGNQGGNPVGNQGGNFGGTGGNQGGNFGGTGGNQGGNFGGTGTGSNNNNGGIVTGGGNNNGGGFNGGNKGQGSIPESPKPVPTTSTTTSNPFNNNNGGPVTLVPPKPKPTPSSGGGLVTGGSETNIFTVPGTRIDCGFSNATHKRIIGGYDSEKDAWPWMSALGYKDSNTGGVSFLCGGALVSDQHVVTASHCVYNRDDLSVVRLGDLNLFSDADGATPIDVPVEKIIRHPDYNPNNFKNDIAVLKLSRKVPLSRAVSPICLPTSTEQRSNRYENTNPFVAGWGAIQFNGPSSVTLREVQLPTVENSICEEKYKPFKSAAVDGNNICAGLQRGGKDACQGDSGGPLMMPQPGSRWILIGVVSYGFKCAEPGFPGVYSRVTSYVDWVTDTMKTA